MMKKFLKNKQNEIREFDIARLLRSKRAMAEYLNQVRTEGDHVELAAAHRHNARAKGMVIISESPGVKPKAS